MDEVPEGPSSGDPYAAAWWAEAGRDIDAETDNVPIGRGASPNEAYDDLVRRLMAIPPTRTRQPGSEWDTTTWEWELRWPKEDKQSMPAHRVRSLGQQRGVTTVRRSSDYLPAQLTDEELQALVASVIAETGALGMPAMGQVMKAGVPQVAGRAEGGRVAAEVRRQLG